MEKRNVLCISFLLITCILFLSYYGWGRDDTNEELQEETIEAVSMTEGTMKGKDTTSELVEQGIQELTVEAVGDSQESKTSEEAGQAELTEDGKTNDQSTENVEDEENQEVKTAVVASNALNVRKKPDKEADVGQILEKGTEVNVLENYEDGWTKIECDGFTGYVYSEYIESK